MTSGRLPTAVAVVALLLIGMAAGIASDRMLQHHRQLRGHQLERIQHDPMSAFEQHFDLSPHQRERITAILASRQARLDSAWHVQRSRVQATVDSMVNEIAAVLDPADAQKFRAIADEIHGRHGLRPTAPPR